MRLGRLARIAAVLLTAGSLAAMPAVAGEVSALAAANPQPAADALRPGLAVTYYYNVFNDTREITDWAK